jgi:hypothetical protein
MIRTKFAQIVQISQLVALQLGLYWNGAHTSPFLDPSHTAMNVEEYPSQDVA